MNKDYDVIVIGSGHAGCEAALATARMGKKTLMLTLNLDSIAFLACNPSIGGTAKGHLVCEIDALGGQMGITADKATIQRRMLNSSKGPAVWSLRAQTDKVLYHTLMKQTLENEPNLDIKQAEASEILTENNAISGVRTAQGDIYKAKAVIVCSGVYLKSRIIIGNYIKECGPNGFQPANDLTASLKRLGLEIFRFKTGTPVRVHADTIDFDELTPQPGEETQNFSFITKKAPKNVAMCYLTYTNEKTHQIIRDNLDKSPMYSGIIEGRGPRYCPSIEDKIVRFADKDKHQLFLEPESMTTKEIYIQGFSTSMPIDVQQQMVNSLKGLNKAHIMRDAYAIEYDCINSLQLYPTLEYKNVSGLYFAGQVNGTSGYEEAGAQGIVAGINAALKIDAKKPFILKRNEAYIGVLIDDLVTKGTNEPYRMMTSRAEYRLILRQDNADLRLTEKGHEVGLVDEKRYKIYKKRVKLINDLQEKLKTVAKPDATLNKLLEECGDKTTTKGISFAELLRRPTINFNIIDKYYVVFDKYPKDIKNVVEINLKYSGYLKREQEQIDNQKKLEDMNLPTDFDYSVIKGLRLEAISKLNLIKPITVGQASRISGVSPADISVLLVYLKAHKNVSRETSEVL